MVKAKGTKWASRRLQAGILGVLALGVGAVLLSSLTGRGPTQALPGPPVKGDALEDRTAVVEVKKALGDEIASLEVSQEPEVGRLTVTTRDSLEYAPPPNFHGRVSAGFEACWVGGGCRAGVVAINVKAVNDSPVARDDSAITGQGRAVAIDVLANDSDPDGDRLSIRSASAPRNGGRVRIAGNWLVLTPRPGFQGTTRVPYTVQDLHGGTSRASVTVRVGPATVAPSTEPGVVAFFQDPGPTGADGPRDPFLQPLPPPVDNDPPQAAFDQVSIPAGGTVLIDVLANDRDPEDDPLSIQSVEVPDGGMAKEVGDRIEFSAPFSAGGDISFAYTVTDRSGATSRTFVVVSVLQVSQAPSSGTRSP